MQEGMINALCNEHSKHKKEDVRSVCVCEFVSVGGDDKKAE